MNVLIVDDSRANRVLLHRFMSLWGFKAIEAENADEAAWVLNENSNFHLIMLDQSMPRVTGVELVRWIRQQPKLTKIPILMISGAAKSTEVAEAVTAGITEFLYKPVNMEVLKAKLDSMGISSSEDTAPKPLSEEEQLKAELRAMGIDPDKIT